MLTRIVGREQMPDFQQQFLSSKGKPIHHGGHEVHLSVRIPVKKGDIVRLTFERAIRTPVQGLRMKAKDCSLEAASAEGKQFVFWRDTAPDTVEVRVVKAKQGAEIVVMNVWRDETHGSTMQGMGFAGITCEAGADGTMVLGCSDGSGPPDFADLVVAIRTGVAGATIQPK